MDFLTFLSKAIEATIWPIFFGTVLFFFRSDLTDLVSGLKLTKIKIKEWEMSLEAVEKSAVLVEAKKAAIEQELTTEQATEKRIESIKEYQEILKTENRLNRLSESLLDNISPGRITIIRHIILDVIGSNKVLALTEEELIIDSSEWIPKIRRGEYADRLTAGALTGLRSAELMDDADRITPLGAAVIKSVAREMATNLRRG